MFLDALLHPAAEPPIHRKESESFTPSGARYGVLYKRYEAEAWWWELSNLSRKLLMVVSKDILNSKLEQLVLVMILVLAYLYLLVRASGCRGGGCEIVR